MIWESIIAFLFLNGINSGWSLNCYLCLPDPDLAQDICKNESSTETQTCNSQEANKFMGEKILKESGVNMTFKDESCMTLVAKGADGLQKFGRFCFPANDCKSQLVTDLEKDPDVGKIESCKMCFKDFCNGYTLSIGTQPKSSFIISTALMIRLIYRKNIF